MARIIFLQPHLRFGGAERQTVIVSNYLASQGHEIHLILHHGGEGLASEVSDLVQVHDLGLESHLATADVARRLHRVLTQIPPALVIVKLWSSILACAMVDVLPGARHHVYNYCEDLDPTDHAEYIRFGRTKQKLISWIFNHREHLSANTQTVADSMVDVYRLRRRPAIIPSTVDIDRTNELATTDPVDFGPGTHIVSVSSLIRRKGLDVTRDALLSIDRPLHWHVVGEGPLREELDGFVDPRGLLTVTAHGGHTNPYRFMSAADLLVHSARSEAWGIVLLESMAVGTPVLAADAIGPKEMHEALGDRDDIMRTYPVGDSSALATMTVEMFDGQPAARQEMVDYIRPFSMQRAAEMWVERTDRLVR
ncbi:glycosyltransferase [Microbacterium sp. NPDC016588]